MKRQYKNLVLTILSLSVILISCSDLKKDLPTATSSEPQIHGQGWLDETSANFHGTAIKNDGWSTDNCKKCHAPDYTGGTSGESCLTCHNSPGGPENCTTCHGGVNAAPPKGVTSDVSRVGTHQSHLLSGHTVGASVACNECHSVPASFASPGHIDSTRAKILFNGTVVTSSLAGLAGSGKPTYTYATFKCDNVYCHGYFPNGNKQSATWNDATGQSRACGSCHGDTSKTTIGDKALPKTTLNGGFHPNNTQCSLCHPSAINSSYQLTQSKHINGKIDY